MYDSVNLDLVKFIHGRKMRRGITGRTRSVRTKNEQDLVKL
jgi:hypothetical protein